MENYNTRITVLSVYSPAFTEDEIRRRVSAFTGMPPEQAREHFGLGADTRDWKVELAQKDLRDNDLDNKGFCRIAYRPFDSRYTYYTGKSRGFHCMPRGKVMHHMLAGENVGLCVSKRQEIGGEWQHVFVADNIVQHHTATAKEVNYLLPLYRYDNEMGITTKRENLKPEFRRWLDERYGKEHAPEDILGCIYAILHSPDYRERYADSLRIDFPRIPFPDDNDEFTRLAAIGNDLIKAHLLQTNFGGELGEHKGTGDSNTVEKIHYDEKKNISISIKTNTLPLSRLMYSTSKSAATNLSTNT